MSDIHYNYLTIFIWAYLLDLILGDPLWLPHPVRGIGGLISFLDRSLRKNKSHLREKGVFLGLFTVLVTCMATYCCLYFSTNIFSYLAMTLSVYLLYSSFSTRSLGQAAFSVYQALMIGNLDLARERLAKIVGRDTDSLNETEVIRATVETVAESSVDGIISPLFYALLGGAPLAMTYKAINTLDSMVGYKNEKYLLFGWFSARLDDWVNYLPARIGALIIPFASLILRQNAALSWKVICRDGHKSPSPNAGYPEAGFAGSLEIQLGGINLYQGRKELKPLLGDSKRDIEKEDIRRAIKLSYTISLLMFFLCVIFLEIRQTWIVR